MGSILQHSCQEYASSVISDKSGCILNETCTETSSDDQGGKKNKKNEIPCPRSLIRVRSLSKWHAVVDTVQHHFFPELSEIIIIIIIKPYG